MQVVEKYVQRDHTSAKHTQVYIHTRVYNYVWVCVCFHSCPIVSYTHEGNQLTVLPSGFEEVGWEEVTWRITFIVFIPL